MLYAVQAKNALSSNILILFFGISNYTFQKYQNYLQKHKTLRAKTAGHVRTSHSRNGFHGILFTNEPLCKRKVSFSPEVRDVKFSSFFSR